MRFQQKPKTFLDASRRDWQFEVFGWLLRNTGGYPKFLESALVLPTEEYFPDRGMKGHAGVAALFRRVRNHAGMEDWPCNVEAAREETRTESEDPNRVPVITYQRGALEPIALVAHFARELGRYLIATFDEPAPGGAAAAEPAIELATVFMGFGLFMANSAANQVKYELSEGELTHALAMFCLLGRNPAESVDKHLNPHLRKHVRLAALDLAQYETCFQKLRSVPGLSSLDRADRTLPTRA
jgi:hypothetical protein